MKHGGDFNVRQRTLPRKSLADSPSVATRMIPVPMRPQFVSVSSGLLLIVAAASAL